MKHFAVWLPMKDEQKSTMHREEHLDYLQKQTVEGHILTYGRFVDGSGGLVIYKAETLEEAENLAKADPYVLTGARELVVKEWALNLEIL